MRRAEGLLEDAEDFSGAAKKLLVTGRWVGLMVRDTGHELLLQPPHGSSQHA